MEDNKCRRIGAMMFARDKPLTYEGVVLKVTTKEKLVNEIYMLQETIDFSEYYIVMYLLTVTLLRYF